MENRGFGICRVGPGGFGQRAGDASTWIRCKVLEKVVDGFDVGRSCASGNRAGVERLFSSARKRLHDLRLERAADELTQLVAGLVTPAATMP